MLYAIFFIVLIMDYTEQDEELQIIFASSPNSFVRNGNGIILGLLIIILFLSALIRYPETVNGNVSLFIAPSSASIVSKSSGRAVLLFKDGEKVKKNTLLGYVESSASLQDVMYFSGILDSLTSQLSKNEDISIPKFKRSLNLGELQPYYVTLINSLNSNTQFDRFNNFFSQQGDIENQILSNHQLKLKQFENLKVAQNELLLMEKKYKRDSLLFEKKVISLSEFEASRLSYLPYKRTYETLNQNILSTEGTISSLNFKSKTLKNENGQTHAESQDNLKSAIISAKGQIDLWKDRYLFISPIEGQISLTNSWNTFQNVNASNELMSIIPNKQGVIAKATVLASGTGKIKIDDEAIISLDDFPQEEYGTLKGRVVLLPTIQSQGNYVIILKLPDGMTTNFDKKIPLREGMSGSVRIVTNNISLFKRLFYQLKKAFNNV